MAEVVSFKHKEIALMLRQMKLLARRQETASRASLEEDVRYTRSAIKKLTALQEETA